MVREQARSVVRVLAGDGNTVVGAGFLIGPDLVATCAHVVADALAADPYSPAPPHGPVLLDFPLVQDPGDGPAAAHVHRWSPIAADGSGDVAVLRLQRPVPHGARMPPLRRVDALWDHGFRVLGFPEGLTDGVWTTGRIRGEQGTRWFQLQGAPGDQAVVGGFSGSPVWDEESGAVVGMTVAADRSADTTTAYLIPIDQVLGLDPELLPCPYRGLEPFGEEHAAFFFGRDPDLDRLVDAVADRPLVAVAGPSGVGKSSLVRAGLLPRERDAGTRIVELRAATDTAPTRALAAGLGPAGSVEDLAAGLDSPDPAVRAEAVQSLVPGPEEPRLLLFVDQFEELAATDPAAARELLLLVAELAGDRVRVVLTVRWESLSELLEPGGPDGVDPVLDAGSALVAGAVLVGAMDRTRLRDAVVGPAERAPGLSFEPGLVDRILDDAGAEPGQLPLVESLLTELWEHRTGGALTVAAYEAAGGVAGAVAKRAEQLLAEFPDPAEQGRLHRLFTLLAQPDRDGRFVRRPVPLAELSADLRALVPRLVAGRLLVVQLAPERGETVELAHQALIQHWPRLSAWLADDRDFLAWRTQLDQQRERWDAADHDPGALLRGTALAAANQWMPARAAEISPAAHDYLRRSRARQRREVRRWRVVTAVLAVLVLAAGTSAVVALDRGNRLDERLRVANAESLAREAQAAAPVDPELSARLALAAWRSDPGNDEARSALARAYLAQQSAETVHADLTTRTIDAFGASADGSVLVVPGANQDVVVVRPGTDDLARRWAVPDIAADGEDATRVSPDGRTLFAASPGGMIRSWDLVSHTPTDLLPTPPDIDVTTLELSPDGSRLSWLTTPTPAGRRVVVWDVAARSEVPHGLPLVTDAAAVTAHLAADPGVVLLEFTRSGVLRGDQQEESQSAPRRAELRTLADGALLWTGPEDPEITDAGLVSCVPAADPQDRATLVVHDVSSRAGPVELRRIPLADDRCTGRLWTTIDGGHVVEERPHVEAVAVPTRVIRLSDGAVFDTVLPPNAEVPSYDSAFPIQTIMAVATAPDGGVSVLRAGGSTFTRYATAPEPAWVTGRPGLQSASGDGRHVVAVEPFGYAAYDRATGRLAGAVAGADLAHVGRTSSTVEGDELRLVVATPAGWVLDRYAVPRFTLRGSHPLPTPTTDPAGRGGATAVRDGDRLYAVSDAQLSVWDTTTGAQLAGPISLPVGRAVQSVILQVRPGHPDQVAIRAEDGVIEVWDALAGRRTARLEPPPDQRRLAYGFTFDRSGDRIVTITHVDTIDVWDVDTRQLTRPPIPLPFIANAAGVDSDGYLVTSHTTSVGSTALTFWDLGAGRQAGVVDIGAHDVKPVGADGRSILLPGLGSVRPVDLPLTAGQWSQRLCALFDRPFTEPELAVLPPGFDPASPCSRSGS
ncbi:trypsin-like peptidase domain-containing protein [Pseudonocardia sp. DSM 110487]|uniref:nSTAND1 domain-containing NTPase n=1 Tax=Pseudonocardia sp. DSM 110487 TaxID=2865833 RepID=UPI001C69FCE6|nr:trypsin-like peptidase domain-containing protein [Pseudonocardia sp. DSM 110487]QYN32034.1 trypsin-like peptidase domain-containing protein [Pseudonocardia sp. DSM 110487]